MIPRGGKNIGNGYVLLPATESQHQHSLTSAERAAVHIYIQVADPGQNPDIDCSVLRWARVLLPCGQTARSKTPSGKKKECNSMESEFQEMSR